MSDFKSQKDIWEYLIAGGKIRHCSWETFLPRDFYELKDGMLKDGAGSLVEETFLSPSFWQKYQEPQKPKKAYAWVNINRNELVFRLDDLAPFDEGVHVRAPEFDIEATRQQ